MLTVQMQAGEICLWAVVDPEAGAQEKTFWIVGTGDQWDFENRTYVGTIQEGPFVWHVFEELQKVSETLFD